MKYISYFYDTEGGTMENSNFKCLQNEIMEINGSICNNSDALSNII